MWLRLTSELAVTLRPGNYKPAQARTIPVPGDRKLGSRYCLPTFARNLDTEPWKPVARHAPIHYSLSFNRADLLLRCASAAHSIIADALDVRSGSDILTFVVGALRLPVYRSPDQQLPNRSGETVTAVAC